MNNIRDRITRLKIILYLGCLFCIPYFSYGSTKNIDTLGIIFRCDIDTHVASIDSVYNATCNLIIPQYIVDEEDEVFEIKYIYGGSFDAVNNLLQKISFPNSLSGIEHGSFADCDKLESICHKDTISFVNSFAFYNCISLIHVNVKSINRIGDNAFQKCISLKNLAFLKFTKSIGNSSFSECESIRSLDMPDCLIELGTGAFSDCTELKTVKFSKKLKEIKQNTFQNCTKLRELFIPENIEVIYPYAFCGCSNLTKVKVSKKCKIWKSAFPSQTTIEYY